MGMNTNNDPFRLDSKESQFFQRELEYIKTRSYDTKYKLLKYASLIPVSTEADPGAQSITFRRYSKIGFAQIISDYANDFPRADAYGEEETAKVRSVGSGFGYSVQEIRESRMVGKSLDQRRANAARRAQEEMHNSLAWSGDSEYGINGLINYPGTTEYTIPDGASGTTPWSAKTPDEIIADMSGIVTAIVDATNGVEAPDTMILPIDQYEYIANTRMTGDSQKTILTFFLENNPHIDMIDWVTELKDAGSSDDSDDRMMVYTRDPEHITYEMPQAIEQFSPQQSGMEFEVPVHSRSGGVIVYYPVAVAYADGI